MLPLAEVKSRLFGHALVSLPFCVYGGPAAADGDAESRADRCGGRARAVAAACEHLELRNRDAKRPHWPRQDLYVTFRKPIVADADANLLAIPRKQRAMVRKGISARPARARSTQPSSASSSSTPTMCIATARRRWPERYFARLVAAFGDACEVLTVTDAGGRPVSGVVSFYFRDEVLPYYAGDTARARDLAANDFKYWDLMRRACRARCRAFSTTGAASSGTGSFDFKKNWGFEPSPLAYEYQLLARDDVPQNNPLNPKYRAFIALWRKLPRSAANMLGPHIARHLG